MKQFFYIVFGDLFVLFVGIGIYSGGAAGADFLRTALSHSGSLSAAAALASSGDPDTTVSVTGFSRIIRYTANQEEDLINEAAQSIPTGFATHMTARAYVVKDLDTGETVVSLNSDQLLPIASLTKLVTAVVARKLIPDAAHITITRTVMATYGNTADFRAGETFSAGDLLYPLLLVSSNDAAEAYAQYYGRAKFIQAMNDFTQSIGAYRTSFADPSGLDPRNVSTADDLALIMDWIRKNDPTIIETTELHAKTVRDHTWINPTHFLSWSYYIGGKNGYLPEADRTAVSLFKLGSPSHTYVVSLLGSDNRDADMIQLLKKVPQ